jgi:hypothetical protein
MRRILVACATVGALSLVASQQVPASDVNNVKGTYGFTLAESCVQQNSFAGTGFDDNFRITDPNGAMTYGGASDGLMVFDGRGGVSFQQAAATNIFNSSSFLMGPNNSISPPTPGSIPLGFGFGPALPFTCTGNYSVSGGKMATISLAVTCTATISPSNPGNPIDIGDGISRVVTGFSSTFNMTGPLPQDPSNLVLTDIGNSVQTVGIFNYNLTTGQSLPDLIAHRVCTRSTTTARISQ